MLKKTAIAVFIGFVALNIVTAVFAFGRTRDRDLSVPDQAIAYQEAVVEGNYELMWELSAPELRDGATREDFIETTRLQSRPPDRMFDWSALNEASSDIARVHTLIQLASGSRQTHRIMLRNIDGDWLVTSYEQYDGPWPPEEPPLPAS